MLKEPLSKQELQIIKLICKQQTAKEIGQVMGLNYRTIEDYRLKIQKKLKAKNNVGIAIYAFKNGLVK